MEYSQPGFSIHEISQARILEWVAISFCMDTMQTQGCNMSLQWLLYWQADSLPLSHQKSPFIFMEILFLNKKNVFPGFIHTVFCALCENINVIHSLFIHSNLTIYIYASSSHFWYNLDFPSWSYLAFYNLSTFLFIIYFVLLPWNLLIVAFKVSKIDFWETYSHSFSFNHEWF